MRIGVDARSLAEPITGIGCYTLELLSRMVDAKSLGSSEHEWILYSHHPLLNGDWTGTNVIVSNWNISNRVLRMLWTHSLLPLLIIRDRVDIFWSPAHRLPNFLPKSVKQVVTVHDLVWRHAPETMQPLGRLLDSWLMPYAVRVADRVITVSQWTADDLIREAPYSAEKIKVIHEATSLPESKNKAIEADKRYLLFVGTLEPRKNLARLLEAYSQLEKEIRDNYSLKIVGGKGWGKEDIRAIYNKLNIVENVQVLGYVDDERLDELYRSATLLAMPSLYEGFGFPILEAMARGIPVLTSNTSSMPEVAGDVAVYVDPYSIESITNGLQELLSNQELRTTLTERGYQRARLFSWDRAAQQTLEVFESVIT